MKTAEIHSAATFRCPRCQHQNFFRELLYEPAPDAPGCGVIDWPQGWHVCRCCGYELTEQQQRPARPGDIGGGVMLPAWFFACAECGRDNFTDVTIYSGDGSEGPPDKVFCCQCRAEFAAEFA